MATYLSDILVATPIKFINRSIGPISRFDARCSETHRHVITLLPDASQLRNTVVIDFNNMYVNTVNFETKLRIGIRCTGC